MSWLLLGPHDPFYSGLRLSTPSNRVSSFPPACNYSPNGELTSVSPSASSCFIKKKKSSQDGPYLPARLLHLERTRKHCQGLNAEAGITDTEPPRSSSRSPAVAGQADWPAHVDLLVVAVGLFPPLSCRFQLQRSHCHPCLRFLLLLLLLQSCPSSCSPFHLLKFSFMMP